MGQIGLFKYTIVPDGENNNDVYISSASLLAWLVNAASSLAKEEALSVIQEALNGEESPITSGERYAVYETTNGIYQRLQLISTEALIAENVGTGHLSVEDLQALAEQNPFYVAS